MKRIVVVIVACLLVAGACRGGDGAMPTVPPVPGASPTATTPPDAPPPTDDDANGDPAGNDNGAPPTAPVGGALRVGIATPQTLDPVLAADPGAAQVVAQLFTPLLVADPVTLQPGPGAASSWDVTPDQLQFTFQMADGARFHDGRPVEAADAKYALERVLRSGGNAAPSLEIVAGAMEFVNQRDVTEVIGIEVVAPDVLVIRLAEPFADFPGVVTNPSLSPLPREAVESTTSPFSVDPVGNGPFRMARQWDQRGPIELTAASDTPITATGVRELRFEPFGNLSLGLLALRRNELDVVSVPPAVLPAVDQEHEDLRTTPFLGTYFFAFNLRDPNLGKPEFRKAIAAAIDREAIVRDVLRGGVEVGHGTVPAAFPGWSPNACGDACAYSEGNARALLVAAFPDGQIPPVFIDVDSDPTQVAVAAAIRDQLRAVGVPAEVRSRPFQEYRDFLTGAVPGEPGLFRSGWVSAAVTPDQFLTPLFVTGRPDNLTGYTNSSVDDLLAETRQDPDPAQRLENYRIAEERILFDMPVLPLASLQTHWVVGQEVEGVVVGPTGTFLATTVAVRR